MNLVHHPPPEVQQFQAFYPLGTRERLALDILLYTPRQT